MEDPERLRTRIRLDLDEVRNRIQEMEDMIESDKRSADSSTLSYNMEELRQLYQYEKKLKQQYEQIAGIQLDAADLRGFDKVLVTGFPFKKRIIAMLMGLIITLNFFNIIIHGIVGFAPMDMINIYLGIGLAMNNLWNVFHSMTDTDTISYYITLFYLSFSIIGSFIIVTILKSRKTILNLFEFIGLSAPSGYLLFIVAFLGQSLSFFESNKLRADFFVDNLLYFGILLVVCGLLILISSLKKIGIIAKILTITAAILYFTSAYYVFLIEFSATKELDSLNNWPYIYLPMYILGYVYILIALFRKSR